MAYACLLIEVWQYVSVVWPETSKKKKKRFPKWLFPPPIQFSRNLAVLSTLLRTEGRALLFPFLYNQVIQIGS